MAKEDICECSHHWSIHMKKIPPFHAQRLKLRVLTKNKHRWCTRCGKWCSIKNADSPFIT